MTKGERKKREQKHRRQEIAEKVFKADLKALLLKHNAKIVAQSHGGAYCSSSVNLEIHIEDNEFEIGTTNDDWTTIEVNGTETLETGE